MTEPLKKKAPPRRRSGEHASPQRYYATLDSIEATTLPLTRDLNERIARIGERLGTRTRDELEGPPTPPPVDVDISELGDVDLHDDDPSTP